MGCKAKFYIPKSIFPLTFPFKMKCWVSVECQGCGVFTLWAVVSIASLNWHRNFELTEVGSIKFYNFVLFSNEYWIEYWIFLLNQIYNKIKTWCSILFYKHNFRGLCTPLNFSSDLNDSYFLKIREVGLI